MDIVVGLSQNHSQNDSIWVIFDRLKKLLTLSRQVYLYGRGLCKDLHICDFESSWYSFVHYI